MRQHRRGVFFYAPTAQNAYGRMCTGTKGAQGEALLRQKVCEATPQGRRLGEFLTTLAWTAAGATLPPYALCVYDSGQPENVVVRAGVE